MTESRFNVSEHVLDHFALRPQKRGCGSVIRDGDGGGGQKSQVKARRPPRPEKDRRDRAVDHRQNNESVKAVSSRRCLAPY